MAVASHYVLSFSLQVKILVGNSQRLVTLSMTHMTQMLLVKGLHLLQTLTGGGGAAEPALALLSAQSRASASWRLRKDACARL